MPKQSVLALVFQTSIFAPLHAPHFNDTVEAFFITAGQRLVEKPSGLIHMKRLM